MSYPDLTNVKARVVTDEEGANREFARLLEEFGYWLKRHGHRPTARLDNVLRAVFWPVFTAPPPSIPLDCLEFGQAVQARVPPAYLAALWLYYTHAQGHAFTGAVFGCSDPAARARLSRARVSLYKAIAAVG